MKDDDLEAELFNPVTTGIFNADWLHDRETGIWRSPLPTEQERDEYRAQYLSMTDAAAAANFDQVYPMLWRLEHKPPVSLPAVMVVLDTGALTDHPLLAGCIEQTVDFTGEGIEDQVGHGTGCALRARIVPMGGCRPRLILGKIFGEDRQQVPRNLVRGIDWASDFATKHQLTTYVMIRLGIYNRRWLGLRSCDGSCEVCKAALRAIDNPLVLVDAAPGNRAGQCACPAAAALRSRPNPNPADPSDALPRLISRAPRDYPDAGLAATFFEGDGRYSYATDTVTLFPPALFYQTLTNPAQAAGLEALRRQAGEPFIAIRGSHQLAKLGNRWQRVPYWPGPQGDQPDPPCPFGLGYDQHGLFLSSSALPGFWIRGPTADEIHAKLPDAVAAYLAQHPELPADVRRDAIDRANGIAGRSQ